MFNRLMALLSQVIAFSAAFIIWFPFIRAWDKVTLKLEKGIA
jgi:cellobiose-specific phosphotransferase system component IIC